MELDYAAAALWFRKAADQGHPNARNNLGIMYDNGWGVPRDEDEAVTWFRRAARQGNTCAQESLRNRGLSF